MEITLFLLQFQQLAIDRLPEQRWTLVKPFACKSNVLQVRQVLGESAHSYLRLSEQSDLEYFVWYVGL